MPTTRKADPGGGHGAPRTGRLAHVSRARLLHGAAHGARPRARAHTSGRCLHPGAQARAESPWKRPRAEGSVSESPAPVSIPRANPRVGGPRHVSIMEGFSLAHPRAAGAGREAVAPNGAWCART